MPIFQNPSAFLLVLCIPVYYVLHSLKIFSKPAFPLILSDWNGQTFEWKTSVGKIARIISGGLFLLGYVSLLLAMADPVKLTQEKVYTSRGTDILFVLDTSPSMAAKDIGGMSRMDAACQAMRALIPVSGGTSFGLVAMASEAALIVPPTTDRDIFFERLASLSLGSLGDGTAIGAGLSTAVYHLASSAAPKKCIVLVTDGENNSGIIHPETSALLAKDYGITLYVLGLGTRGSVPLEYVDPVTGQVYSGFLDSQFDASTLEKIAFLADGRYFGVESSGALATALSTITSKEQSVQSFYMKSFEEPLYHGFLFAAAIFFIVAWLIRRVYLGEQV